jgi:hypothetical protein
MDQLSNLMPWFKLHAMWRIGGKPLQRVDECAARHRDLRRPKKKNRKNRKDQTTGGEEHWPTAKQQM